MKISSDFVLAVWPNAIRIVADREGFNLDPPRVDPNNGEMASRPTHRTAVDPRHLDRAAVLFVDSHCAMTTPVKLSYVESAPGVTGFDGANYLFSSNGRDEAWVAPANHP